MRLCVTNPLQVRSDLGDFSLLPRESRFYGPIWTALLHTKVYDNCATAAANEAKANKNPRTQTIILTISYPILTRWLILISFTANFATIRVRTSTFSVAFGDVLRFWDRLSDPLIVSLTVYGFHGALSLLIICSIVILRLCIGRVLVVYTAQISILFKICATCQPSPNCIVCQRGIGLFTCEGFLL